MHAGAFLVPLDFGSFSIWRDRLSRLSNSSMVQRSGSSDGQIASSFEDLNNLLFGPFQLLVGQHARQDPPFGSAARTASLAANSRFLHSIA